MMKPTESTNTKKRLQTKIVAGFIATKPHPTPGPGPTFPGGPGSGSSQL